MYTAHCTLHSACTKLNSTTMNPNENRNNNVRKIIFKLTIWINAFTHYASTQNNELFHPRRQFFRFLSRFSSSSISCCLFGRLLASSVGCPHNYVLRNNSFQLKIRKNFLVHLPKGACQITLPPHLARVTMLKAWCDRWSCNFTIIIIIIIVLIINLKKKMVRGVGNTYQLIWLFVLVWFFIRFDVSLSIFSDSWQRNQCKNIKNLLKWKNPEIINKYRNP